MPRCRHTLAASCFALVSLVLCLGPGVAGGTSQTLSQATTDQTEEYVVLYRDGVATAAAHAALAAAGGQLVSENSAIGLALVRSSKPDFVVRVGGQPALAGATRNEPMWKEPRKLPTPEGLAGSDGSVKSESMVQPQDPDSPTDMTTGPAADPLGPPTGEPLALQQWDMAMIGATATGAFRVQLGDARVRVGVIDTGIDASHPDIAPNFDPVLSRNFTTDIPAIDGPCKVPSCIDPPNVDHGGHGTHVAGIIAAALNGVGTAGVAPGVTLVNLRAGQPSGFFFLKPTIDAITYAADNGINVVNMSFFTDPWLYNCRNNPSDTPAEQLEQRTVIEATQKAVDYAWNRGVTLVAALGNEHTDLDRKSVDTISPDYPAGASHTRTVDSSCITVPTELPHVISVAAVGPSGKKADYSNYSLAHNAMAAPGGFLRDLAAAPGNSIGNEVLAPYPANVLRAQGLLDQAGIPRTPDVIRDCTGGTCAYWRYLQGTSMASPHVAGVAALIVSQFGTEDQVRGGLTMAPALVEHVLRTTAARTACPAPVITYDAEGRDASYNATCEGTAAHNSVYGDGIVNAAAAVSWSSAH
jgi:subtilisin family serine protease